MAPKKILIVGGGSTGWIVATHLTVALNGDGRRVADVTLIESPDVPRIGVGEATIPSIRHIASLLDIGEADFLRRVDGTFKQAIKFINWLENKGESYYHPFNRYRDAPLDRTTLRWLMSDRSLPFGETVSAQPRLCELNKAPQMLGPWDFGPPLTYAYHINALKFADMLCEFSTQRGVVHHLDQVVDVDLDENGNIETVVTKGGKKLQADLYIDCTGFAALLIEKKMGIRWVDCSQWLLCDRAITMQVPYDHHYLGFIRPYTTASALSSGWVWDIPLQDKRSLGYVHSSTFIDENSATLELRSFEGHHSKALSTNTVYFRVGHREKAWVGNCISMGLSGSFIEPLESTGLYLSDLAAVMLVEHFPYGEDLEPLAYRFNRIMVNRFYEILDFINMHYCLTRRNDSMFWREVQKPDRINGRLRAKLEFWKVKPPSTSDFEDQFFPGQPDNQLPSASLLGDHRSAIDTGALFGLGSHEAILYGMDFLREQCIKWFGNMRTQSTVAKSIEMRLVQANNKLPPHHIWLQHCAGMKSFSPTSRTPT